MLKPSIPSILSRYRYILEKIENKKLNNVLNVNYTIIIIKLFIYNLTDMAIHIDHLRVFIFINYSFFLLIR